MLTAGQRLGPYEVVSPLGAGGMGEVWTARDSRLGRLVAIKVLPREFAADPERRSRLEREARVVSALAHPHVCALYDVGELDGPGGALQYLVMEKVEGETLAERLGRGPLPVSEALLFGRQLAEALGAAHRRGIVHRDLKPANVMLTRAGVKLLDFGLAQRDGDESSLSVAEPLSDSVPTLPKPAPRAATLVGTLPYVAPERLRGLAADARSDVFALGCVLYESLTARRAFPGQTQKEVVQALLAPEPPDVREASPSVPAALATLVSQCLAKDPAARWQCAEDVARGLRVVEAAPARQASAATSRAARVPLAAAAVLALLAVTAAAALVMRRPVLRAQPLRFTVPPPPGVLVTRPTAGTTFALSHDGRHLVFTADAGGVSGLWLWSAEDGEARRVEQGVGGVAPFFSPDGREIGFFAANELRRVPVTGGPATTIAAGVQGTSASWGSGGTIVFSMPFAPDGGLYSVPERGGEVRSLLPAPPPERVAFPRLLPDGRHYLYLSGYGSAPARRRVCVASLDGGASDCFGSCHSQAEYAASGHVLCVVSGSIVAIPFDTESRRPIGAAVPVAADVHWFGPSGAAAFSVSGDGRALAYAPRPAPSRLAWLDRTGRELAALGEPAPYGLLQLSPDDRQIAIEITDPSGRGRDVWLLDAATGLPTRLTFGVDVIGPAWSPDGSQLTVGTARDAPPDVALLQLDGSGREQLVLRMPGIQIPKDWSPDGRLVVFEDHPAGRRELRQLWLLSLADGKARRATPAPSSSYQGAFSPDGLLAYVSEESGRPEVYLLELSGGRPPRRISRAGGVLPRFRGDGRELFFFQPDGMMMAVAPREPSAVPQALFHLEGVTAFAFDYDVARDGKRFLVRLTSEPEGAAGLRVALEWAHALGAAQP